MLVIPGTSSRCECVSPFLHYTAEVGAFSSPAHRDHTSVTELHTNGALQLLEAARTQTAKEKLTEIGLHLLPEPRLNLDVMETDSL